MKNFFNKTTILVLVAALLAGSAGAYAAMPAPPPQVKPLVAPGELDTYYAFIGGGKNGDVEVMALPSERILADIPVFAPDADRGYDQPTVTDATTIMVKNSGGHDWGVINRPVLSETGGQYDGNWLFVQDAQFGRVAKISLKYFDTEAIEAVPGVPSVQGLAVNSDTSQLAFYGKTAAGDGVFGLVNPRTLATEVAVDYPGQVTGVTFSRDGSQLYLALQNSGSQGNAVAAVPVGSLTDLAGKAANVPWSALTSGVRTVAVPAGAGNLALSPDGKYLVAGGKDSDTVAVIDTASFNLAGSPKIGPEPVSTTFDGQGAAYTALYGQSRVVKWDIAKALAGNGNYSLDQAPAEYNPAEVTTGGDGPGAKNSPWLLAVDDQSGSRYLYVGAAIRSAQLVSLQGGQMKVISEAPLEPYTTGIVMVKADRLDPAVVYPRTPDAVAEGQSRVVRTGPHSVHIYMTARRSEFGLKTVHVKQGDQVTWTITNIENVENIIHGLAIEGYNINYELPPGKTVTFTFTASKPGVYWFYCTYFCSALHLEMRSRLIVDPA